MCTRPAPLRPRVAHAKRVGKHLPNDQKVRRFSELERATPAVSQKMLIQQLRQLEADGIVRRIVHQQVPPKVEYRLTE